MFSFFKKIIDFPNLHSSLSDRKLIIEITPSFGFFTLGHVLGHRHLYLWNV